MRKKSWLNPNDIAGDVFMKDEIIISQLYFWAGQGNYNKSPNEELPKMETR